jgi:glycosyltransferase involved in cell wall biosynthesis
LLRARRIRALHQLLKGSDVLHVQAVGISCLDGFVAAAMSRARPVIVTHHGTLSWFAPQRDLLADVTFWIEKRLASQIVVPYAAAAAEMAAEGIAEHQTRIIPFCVDEQLFSGLASTPAPGELTLVTVARMVDGKGHIELLAALAKLSPRYPKLRAVFIGDGPIRGKIEAEIDRLGLRSVVDCKGKIDHRDVPALMLGAHVVVLPSYETGEMFPLCLLEGMALGLPAIGTHWSGIPDIIEDGKTGILIAPRDENGLADAIERFLAEPGFYALARANAMARVQSRFTATLVAKTYSESYLAALKR